MSHNSCACASGPPIDCNSAPESFPALAGTSNTLYRDAQVRVYSCPLLPFRLRMGESSRFRTLYRGIEAVHECPHVGMVQVAWEIYYPSPARVQMLAHIVLRRRHLSRRRSSFNLTSVVVVYRGAHMTCWF
mmetsp:Transcript_108805/g.281227  ORF Transcript_108805/g.281227 Transcript_108805/m.281227 type:complete len:131 (+) Transcript_108805:1309-1701(+)